MARSWLHRLLETPLIYRATQAVVGIGAGGLERIYRQEFGAARGRILDVGCGPTADTPLVAGTLVGLDVNLHYVERYMAGPGYGDLRLGVVGSAARVPFRDGVFDQCRSAAMLHHLPDELARDALCEMYRTLREGGSLVVFDMVWPTSFRSSPVAWVLCRIDRGEWVRSEERLLQLARSSCAGEWRHRSFSYTWLRLRGSVLVLRKPGE